MIMIVELKSKDDLKKLEKKYTSARYNVFVDRALKNDFPHEAAVIIDPIIGSVDLKKTERCVL